MKKQYTTTCERTDGLNILVEGYVCNACEYRTSDFMSFITHRNDHAHGKRERIEEGFKCGRNRKYIWLLFGHSGHSKVIFLKLSFNCWFRFQSDNLGDIKGLYN